MKLIELLEATNFPESMPRYWGGWLHTSGKFYPVQKMHGHWVVALTHYREFGLESPDQEHRGQETWHTMFQAGWIRVLFSSFEGKDGIEFNGFEQQMRAALNNIRRILNDQIEWREAEYIYLDVDDKAYDIAFDFFKRPKKAPKQFNKWLRG